MYHQYQECYLPLINDVSKIPGWYLWYNSNSGKVIYIGASKSLNGRLRERLTDGYVIFWMKSPDDNDTVADLNNYITKNILQISKDQRICMVPEPYG